VSRRGEIQLSEDEQRELIESERIVVVSSLGTRGWPHSMPLWYVPRSGEVWIYTYAKSQKVRNLERDPRATLLVEGWDPLDWSQLWWVRVELRRTELDDAQADGLARLLRDKYLPYRDATFAALLTFDLGPITGWAATA
jgi:nitroimidazol reductase NimA-like FMN-containing flavoprotein (pyridoxamine 5'-phosphate oxidase superfamily)